MIILVPSLVLGALYRFAEFEFSFLDISSLDNITDEIALTGIIVGLLLIAFSREKQEDEYINSIRLQSLQWAVLINYVLLIAATWIVYGLAYIDVMVYNMLTVLIIFIVRFHLALRKEKRTNPE
jgi:hypothetical protein